jgi:hypothetical protein
MASAAKKKRTKKYRPSGQTKMQMLGKQVGAIDLAFAKRRQEVNDAKELAIREAAMGATLSFNSAWDDSSEFYPSNTERLMDLLLQHKEAVCGVLVSWHFDWDVLLTVYFVDQDGQKYEKFLREQFELLPMCTPAGQEEGPNKMLGIEELIEGEYLQKILKTRNPNHVVESWGYMATITYFEDEL